MAITFARSRTILASSSNTTICSTFARPATFGRDTSTFRTRFAFLSGAVNVRRDGSIRGRTKEAKRLIEALRLDSPSYRQRRRLMIEIVRLACEIQPGPVSRADGFSRRPSQLGRTPSARRQHAASRREEVLLRTPSAGRAIRDVLTQVLSIIDCQVIGCVLPAKSGRIQRVYRKNFPTTRLRPAPPRRVN